MEEKQSTPTEVSLTKSQKVKPKTKAKRPYMIPFIVMGALFGITLLILIVVLVAGIVAVPNSQLSDNSEQKLEGEGQGNSLVDESIQPSVVEDAEDATDLPEDTIAESPPEQVIVEVPAPCDDQEINIMFGTFTIPCDWHSYFEYQPVEERSHGFVGEDQLLLLGASDAPVGDAGVGVRVFSNYLGNYDSDPLATEMTNYPAASISDVTSDSGINFKQVTLDEGYFEGNPTNIYFAQYVAGPDEVWMVTFSNNVGGVVAEDLIDSFNWTP